MLHKSVVTQAQISIGATCQVDSLLLEVFDELLGFVVLLLQSLVLRLGLLQVFVDSVAEGLRLDPVALQLQHPLLVLLDAGLQLGLLLLPALLLPLHGCQLTTATLLEQQFRSFSRQALVRAATPGANGSKIYLVFQLLDLGLSDCVFDLELLGAEMGEKKKRREERVVIKCMAAQALPLLWTQSGGWRQRTP